MDLIKYLEKCSWVKNRRRDSLTFWVLLFWTTWHIIITTHLWQNVFLKLGPLYYQSSCFSTKLNRTAAIFWGLVGPFVIVTGPLSGMFLEWKGLFPKMCSKLAFHGWRKHTLSLYKVWLFLSLEPIILFSNCAGENWLQICSNLSFFNKTRITHCLLSRGSFLPLRPNKTVLQLCWWESWLKHVLKTFLLQQNTHYTIHSVSFQVGRFLSL